MMLDPKRTFDELIERIAPDPERAAEIKSNRVYRELSTAVSGSQEFTAIAKLYELDHDANFDLLVLDTPPSRNALDFLDAPGRLTSFLEGRALSDSSSDRGRRWASAGRVAAARSDAASHRHRPPLRPPVNRTAKLLGDAADDFSARARQVQEMLTADTTAFVLVTSAQAEAIEETLWFRRTLEEGGLPFAGAVVNRVHRRCSATGARASTGRSNRGKALKLASARSSPPASPRTSAITTSWRTATPAISPGLKRLDGPAGQPMLHGTATRR